ncbi:MAG: PAS domain-containing protein [Elusimicrobia bacterium]|nr:PAS domain-containing protein [Elusimicrobiota bacterium]
MNSASGPRRIREFPGAFIAGAVFLGLFLAGRFNPLLFHCLSELFSVVMAFGVFLFAWNMREFLPDDYFLFLGIAFFFVGIVDAFHLLSYPGMPAIPGFGASLSGRLWMLVCFLESLSLFAASFFFSRRIRILWTLAGFTAAVAAGLAAMRLWRGGGELALVFFLAAILLLQARREHIETGTRRLMIASILIMMASEGVFILFSRHHEGVINTMGHMLKAASFFLIYKAIVETGLKKPYRVFFRILKESEERFTAFMDHLPVVAFIKDEMNRYLYMNIAMKKVLDVEGWSGKKMADGLFPPETMKLIKETDKHALATGFSRGPLAFTGKSGMERKFDVYKFPIRSEGKPPLLGGIAVDITERESFLERLKGLNAELESRVRERTTELSDLNAELTAARDQALAAAGMKSQFMANMSHEIRTPLNAVIGLAELMRDTPLDGQQKDWMETIHQSAKSLLFIVNDVLDFSKIEAGKMELEMRDFDLRWLIEETTDLFRMETERKELYLKVRLAKDLPALVRGDAGRLRQVFVNLIGNAVKFTESGGVSVRGEWIRRGRATALRFEVEDTGIGVPPEYRKFLFKPFTQANASMTRLYGGTGLGLAISKQILDLMGGRIGVEDRAPGSLFWLEAPLRLPAKIRGGETQHGG